MNNAMLIGYMVIMIAIFYFIGIRPQRQQQKKHDEMLKAMAVGDYCVTTSGFYGQIIDITNDMVIVEFGNKNCRIPMIKNAIQSIEKPGAAANGSVSAKDVSETDVEKK